MNAVDIALLAVLGLSTLFGLYRGFVASVASLGGSILSLVLSYWLNPRVVDWVQSNPDILRSLSSYFTNITAKLDPGMADATVNTLNENAIVNLVEQLKLPAPLDSLLQNNLLNRAFGELNLSKVGEYISTTLVSALLNVVCFIVLFFALNLVLHFLLNFLKAVFKFPVLKQLNALVGGVFGLLRGGLFCLILVALVPLAKSVAPPQLMDMVEQSKLVPFFNARTLIEAMMTYRK